MKAPTCSLKENSFIYLFIYLLWRGHPQLQIWNMRLQSLWFAIPNPIQQPKLFMESEVMSVQLPWKSCGMRQSNMEEAHNIQFTQSPLAGDRSWLSHMHKNHDGSSSKLSMCVPNPKLVQISKCLTVLAWALNGYLLSCNHYDAFFTFMCCSQ